MACSREIKNINVPNNFLLDLSKNAGYSIIDAINELIDNAKDANAKKVEILFDENNNILTIKDDGNGMQYSAIEKCFNLNGSNNKYNANASGRFGMGMKTGIVCLCNLSNNDSLSNVIIKSKAMNDSGVTIFYNVSRDNNMRYELTNECDLKNHGTIIEINNTCMTTNDINDLRNLLGTYYYPIMSTNDFNIYLNGIKINPEDPLYRTNKNVMEDQYIDSINVVLNEKTYTFHIHCVNLNNNKIGNNFNKYDSCRRKKVEVTENSGLYIIYGNRYIALGNNLNLVGKSLQPSAAGIRLELTIPKELSEILGVQWNKTSKLTPFYKIKEFNILCTTIKKIFSEYISSRRNNALSNSEKKVNNKLAKKFKLNDTQYTIDVDCVENTNDPWIFSPRNKKIVLNKNSEVFDIIRKKYASKSLEPIYYLISAMAISSLQNGGENETKDLLGRSIYAFKQLIY